MPKIQEYNPQVQAPGPVDVHANAAEFGGQAAQGLESLGQNTAEGIAFLQRKTNAEDVANQHESVANALADRTAAVKETLRKADPAKREEIATQLMDDTKKAFDNLQENAETPAGRNFLTRAGASAQKEINRLILAGKQELAGAASVNQHATTINSLAGAVHDDPSLYDHAVSQNADGLRSLVQTEGSGLTEEKALKIHTTDMVTLAVAAVHGTMEDGGDKGIQAARTLLASDKFDIPDSVATRLQKDIDNQEKGNERDALNREKLQEKLLKQQQKTTQDGFLDKLHEGTLDWDTVKKSNLNPFGEGSKDTFSKAIATQNTAAAKDNHLLSDLTTRVLAPNGTADKIYEQAEVVKYVGKGLTTEGAKTIFSLMDGNQTPDGRVKNSLYNDVLKAAAGQISKSRFGMPDPDGGTRMTLFQEHITGEWTKLAKEGKSDPEIANEMIKDIPKFKGSPQDIMKAVSNEFKPKPNNPVNELPGFTPPPPPAGKALMYAPDGTPGYVDKSRVQEFLGKHYKKGQ